MSSVSKALLLAAFASSMFSLAPVADCAEPGTNGFYVGASGGATEFDDDGWFQGANYDDSDSGYGIFAGYKFLRYLSAEGRYSDLGFDTTAFSAHVVGIIPFGKSGWELFGQLGVGSVDIDEFDTRTVGSAGIGVRFYPTSHLGISLQTDAYVFEEDDYNPGFGSTQLAIHYLF